MFVFKRNQVIISALVVMIAVAGYLSWSDSRTQEAIGFDLNLDNEISALIPDHLTLVGLFGDDDLFATPWVDTHNTEIAMESDLEWPALSEVNLEELMLPPEEAPPSEVGEAVFVNTNSSSSFFVQARLNREQSRSGERAILNDLINNNNVDIDHRAEAADRMLEIQRRIERETAAEALIESKGFQEAYVRISDNGVDVIVSRDTLTDPDLAQIMDIVKRKTGLNEQQIHISPMRR